ncbi:MAG TPA: helix-turn-helix domain-containing protein [Streptosporangiaceae bacterium]|nr:helix-turn-helix domain-containing protein [Streptosporangiaceae bacterium]
MDWEPGYREWAPPPGLDGSVACLWTSVVPPGGATRVLPDACCDLIWESGRGAYVAGPDTGPWSSAPTAGAVFAGVRLRPGAGGPALGLPLSALLDLRVDAADLGTGFGARLARLGPALAPAVALRLLTAAAAEEIAESPADPLVTEAARLLGRSRTQAGDVAIRLGVGERQLLRRCRAAVGYGPATLRRVLRFRRFISRLDTGEGGPAAAAKTAWPGGLDLASLAAETGYADQAHLTRECVRLAGLPPSVLAAARRPAAA